MSRREFEPADATRRRWRAAAGAPVRALVCGAGVSPAARNDWRRAASRTRKRTALIRRRILDFAQAIAAAARARRSAAATAPASALRRARRSSCTMRSNAAARHRARCRPSWLQRRLRRALREHGKDQPVEFGGAVAVQPIAHGAPRSWWGPAILPPIGRADQGRSFCALPSEPFSRRRVKASLGAAQRRRLCARDCQSTARRH